MAFDFPRLGRRLARALTGALSAEDDPEMRAALAAGWRRADLEWERLADSALDAWAAGDCAGAARLWRRGWIVARRRFPTDDPRRATALANAGLADLVRGRARRAARRRAEARRLWEQAPGWIRTAEVRPLARSSLFHLRMQARHRTTFAERSRSDLMAYLADVLDRLDRPSSDRRPEARPDRWRRERPPVHDDRRKLVAAALLLAA